MEWAELGESTVVSSAVVSVEWREVDAAVVDGKELSAFPVELNKPQ